MRVIHEKCDPKLADDRKLPYTAYLVQYEVDGKETYDIAMGTSQVELSLIHISEPTRPY